MKIILEKKKNILLFIFISIVYSNQILLADDIYRYEDRLVGLSINCLLEKFGTPVAIEERNIRKNYVFVDEIEPDYSEYFSEKELNDSVVIYLATWKNEYWVTVAFLRQTDNDWITFSSFEYDSETVDY